MQHSGLWHELPNHQLLVSLSICVPLVIAVLWRALAWCRSNPSLTPDKTQQVGCVICSVSLCGAVLDRCDVSLGMRVCMYAYMRACLSVCAYACMRVCVYACLHVCVYVWVYARVYVCMCLCMHACVYVCMYVCMYVCVYVCLYVCMYVCMYVYARVFCFPTAHSHDTGIFRTSIPATRRHHSCPRIHGKSQS